MNAEGSAFATGGLKVKNHFADFSELVTDDQGNTYMKKNSGNGSNGFYIYNTDDKIFNDKIIEISFDWMYIEGSANCSILGFKVGGEIGSDNGTEYRALCNWGKAIRVGANEGPDILASNTETPTWVNIKVQMDTATYNYKVWLDGELAADVDLVNGLIKYKGVDGAWAEKSTETVTKLATTADKEADFTSIYLFHYNGALTWAIDNLSIGIVEG